MVHDRNRGSDLDTTREALASWRRLHGGRGRPIPAALWSDAADVARANGVAETARALRLDPRKLAKLAEGEMLSSPRSVVERGFRIQSAPWARREPIGAIRPCRDQLRRSNHAKAILRRHLPLSPTDDLVVVGSFALGGQQRRARGQVQLAPSPRARETTGHP